MKTTFSKINISAFVAVLFHISGLMGILLSTNRDWFIRNTPLNLILMAGLLILNQKKVNKIFIFFFVLCFVIGMLTEMIGVNTGLLFGNYAYGNILGVKLLGVPLLIGLNWFVIVYCCIVLMEQMHLWVKTKFRSEEQPMPSVKFETLSVIVDGAMLATYFDWLMEPIAVKLGYWQWGTESIPIWNYFCWFLISALLIAISRKLNFNKQNPFAVHLLFIQALFFLALRTFL